MQMEARVPNYQHVEADIRDPEAMGRLFSRYGGAITGVIHTAAQPSHDWAARDPMLDFTVNANGTLVLLEMTRQYCPEAVFIFTSTNKVYGDTPNSLPLVELETRWELQNHPYAEHGIDEQMSIDQSKHSLFGASKVAADVMVQEYGRYFGLKTGVFRGGLPHWACPFRNRIAWISGVSGQVCGDRQALHGFWLQGETGP